LAYSEACESAISKRDKTIDTIMPILETLSYGLTKEQITVILEKLRIDDSIMDIENNSILYNELEFLFQDGKLVKIEWPIEIDSYVAPE
jgi:hypothetical protein